MSHLLTKCRELIPSIDESDIIHSFALSLMMNHRRSHHGRHDNGHHNSRLHRLDGLSCRLSCYFSINDLLDTGFAAFQLLFIEDYFQKTRTVGQ